MQLVAVVDVQLAIGTSERGGRHCLRLDASERLAVGRGRQGGRGGVLQLAVGRRVGWGRVGRRSRPARLQVEDVERLPSDSVVVVVVVVGVQLNDGAVGGRLLPRHLARLHHADGDEGRRPHARPSGGEALAQHGGHVGWRHDGRTPLSIHRPHRRPHVERPQWCRDALLRRRTRQHLRALPAAPRCRADEDDVLVLFVRQLDDRCRRLLAGRRRAL